ncbi:MAG: hypothetical protein HND45_11835 [Chloroflexi bacterium]|jgi:hypothetical protein|nr:hypothetical protein [Chloroflexota bacterium]NOG76568.1 hypothetical protein [Chloroflexota bacterium]GJQ37265.1 MAG: hypothetical protein JETCAE01_32750 [Anaerolineaceae bacterium]
MKYQITLDTSKNIFEKLPVIEAPSPKEAAEIYAGCPVERHLGRLGGEIVVKRLGFPAQSFLYDKRPASSVTPLPSPSTLTGENVT